MDLETLYRVVTERITSAEALAELGAPGAADAFRDVSLVEDQIASQCSADSIEGELARRGAIRAAINAGDLDRARGLFDLYCEDRPQDDAVRRSLLSVFDSEDVAAPGTERAELPAQMSDDIRVRYSPLEFRSGERSLSTTGTVSALRQVAVSQRLVFVVGSGVSADAGMPTWNDLRRLGAKSASSLHDYVVHGHSEAPLMGPMHFALRDLCLACVNRSDENVSVVTTNFDSLIERALASYGAWGERRVEVSHVHGHFRRPDETPGHVATHDDYDNTTQDLKTSFSRLLGARQGATVIFLGMSVADPSVDALLRIASDLDHHCVVITGNHELQAASDHTARLVTSDFRGTVVAAGDRTGAQAVLELARLIQGDPYTPYGQRLEHWYEAHGKRLQVPPPPEPGAAPRLDPRMRSLRLQALAASTQNLLSAATAVRNPLTIDVWVRSSKELPTLDLLSSSSFGVSYRALTGLPVRASRPSVEEAAFFSGSTMLVPPDRLPGVHYLAQPIGLREGPFAPMPVGVITVREKVRAGVAGLSFMENDADLQDALIRLISEEGQRQLSE